MQRETTTPFGRTIYPSRVDATKRGDLGFLSPRKHIHKRGCRSMSGRCIECGDPIPQTT